MILTPEQVKWSIELRRCQKDFQHAAKTYFHIKSKHTIGFPTLQFTSIQQQMYAQTMDQLKRKGYVRKIYGKARQQGISTYWLAFNFWNVVFKPNRNALLITHDEPTSYELFTVDQLIYESLPPPLQPVKRADTRFKMEFDRLNSKIMVGHARNLNVGASQMTHLVHLTEVARYENADEVQSSLFPSISDAKGEHYSSIVLESTSQIGGMWFRDFAEAAMAGENEFEFHFFPWFTHEEYQMPVNSHFRPTQEEAELIKEYKLTYPQIAWWRAKRATYMNPAMMMQDFPWSWASSWILPSGSLRTFPDEDLVKHEGTLRAGRRMGVAPHGIDEHLGGLLEVWQLPREGVFYHLGVDPSGGRNEQADWTGINVIRGDTFEQVAECKYHFDPADKEFHDFVYWLGMAYNCATIIPDITGGWGHSLMNELQRRSYPNIWQWRRRDDIREKVSARVGFLYSKRDKITLVTTGVMTVRQQRCVIHSQTLLNEMRYFLQVGADEWTAAPGTHDDVLNAWLLAVLSATDAKSSYIDGPELSAEQRIGYVNQPFMHDVDMDLGDRASRGMLNLAAWQ